MTRPVTNATWARLDAALEAHPYLVILAVRLLCIRKEFGHDVAYPYGASRILLVKLRRGLSEVLARRSRLSDDDLRSVAARYDRRMRVAIDRMWPL